MVRFPRNQEQVNNTIRRNRAMGGRLPNVVGYIDGSLIKIMKPSIANNRQAFIGRKSFASMNVLFTCDRRLYVLNVLARYPGATNDSSIYGQSAVRRRMIELQRHVPCLLLGDSGFPQEPWLMTPYARQEEPEEDAPEARYNADHCSDRNAVERVIGVMKGKWRAINDERVLHYYPVRDNY
ncbi:Putative nuclease [Frankliniella fusca]|uniref:Nuclease n=1 Tax=Frankliniella fusca TaxID=407009 RepID=A0AAE1HSL5_9NEOP|nr:Putative nuclease [Frankliniella fusca]